jgi:hypothetical protein
MPVGRLFKLNADDMPNNVWELFWDIWRVADKIEKKYLLAVEETQTAISYRRIAADVTRRLIKMSGWSTKRIDALEQMNAEQLEYWMELK